MEDNSINILLVEDHEITRLGMKTLLMQMKNINVIGEATSGSTAVASAKELEPDLVIMDIGLPDMDGIEATKSIKQALSTKVLMLTSHDAVEDILAGMTAGADGYCLKTIGPSELNNAIYSVMDGAIWLDPNIAKKVIDLMAASKNAATRVASIKSAYPASPNNTFKLSEREYKVLCLVVEGLSNQQIGDRLFVSTETVKTHMRRVMEKLAVSDRTQAAVKAIVHGLVTPPER